METGARINEALNLTYGDIYEDYIVLYTRKTRYGNRTPRKIPKPKCLKDLNGSPTDRVFPDWKTRPKFLQQKLKKLGLKSWSWHCLRHRYASKLSKQNKPFFEIMSLMGHSSVANTQIYMHLLGS
jgi:integrase